MFNVIEGKEINKQRGIRIISQHTCIRDFSINLIISSAPVQVLRVAGIFWRFKCQNVKPNLSQQQNIL